MAVTPNFAFPTPNDSDPVSEGAEAIRALGDAVDAQFAGGFQFAGTRFFTANGTFVKADPLGTGDIGLRAIRVRVQGGGGAGGGAATTSGTQNSHGAGGGSGTFAEAFITDIAGLASSVTVTRGAGGAGVSAAAGGAGGASSFGGLLVCPGGGGGGFRTASASATTSASGGTAGGAATGTVTPDFSSVGVIGGGSFSVNPALAVGGVGATSFLGFAAGAQVRLTASATANASSGFGAGGSGSAAVVSNTTARAGRAGQAGIVIVEVFV